jgi:hypothetical protein
MSVNGTEMQNVRAHHKRVCAMKSINLSVMLMKGVRLAVMLMSNRHVQVLYGSQPWGIRKQ